MAQEAIKVELVGEEEAAAVLRALESPEFLRPAHERAGVRLTGRLKRYPPPPPDSRYRRTGTLGRRWTFVVRRDLFGVATIVGNNTIYGPYVQDPDQQAAVHRGRWETTAEALEQEKDAIVKDVVDTIGKRIEEAKRGF